MIAFYDLGMRVIRIVVRVRRLHIVKLVQLWCKMQTIWCCCMSTSIIFTHFIHFAWLYRRKRVFILGPSHHVRLRGCALTTADKYETPLYDLKIDTQINAELEKTGKFTRMDMNTDEDEHSIEMHLPYIAKVMNEWVILNDLFLEALLGIKWKKL